MAEQEDQFHPDLIDEQIKHYSSFAQSRPHQEPDPDKRLFADLHLLGRENEDAAREDAFTLQSAWERIETAHPQSAQKLSSPIHERIIPMQKPRQSTPDLYERRTWSQRLGLLAAVAAVLVLIGSATYVFSLRSSHQSTLGSANTPPTVAPVKQGETMYVEKLPGFGIYGVKWSPDGQHVVAWGTNVNAWDAATGTGNVEYAKLPSPANMSQVFGDVVWSPDGKYIAVPLASGGDIQIWDVKANKSLKTLHYNLPPWYIASTSKGKVQRFLFLNWSSDGTSIRTITPINSKGVSQDTLLTFNIATGAVQEQTLATIDLFNRVVWSPDGKYLAASYADTFLVHVIDLHTGQVVYTYSGPATVVDLAWSPNSQRVVSGFGDGLDETRVWDATTGAHVVIHKGGTTPAWSPDGKYIATARMDPNAHMGPTAKQSTDTIEIWDAQTAQNVYTYTANQGHVYALAWSPDSKSIASSDSGKGQLCDVRVWRAIA